MFSVLYAGICGPIFYSLGVVTLYFCRFRKPVEIGLALVGMVMYVSFPAGTVVYTIEGVAHPDYSETVGLLPIYLSVATSAVCCSMLVCYLAWQRVRHAGPVTARSAAGRSWPAPAGEVNEPSPTDREGPTEQPLSGSGGVSPAAAVQAESGEVQDESANSRARRRLESSAVRADALEHVDPNGGQPAAAQSPPGAQRVASQQPGRKPGAFLRLLPERLGTDLIYIKSEDHYLEVHTAVGSSLVKMRFSDAVAELGDRGMQVHRSYWVATSHVTRSVRNGKRTLLRLTGDHTVPVSVTHLPAVRAALAR